MPVSQQNERPAEGKVLHLYLKKLVWQGAAESPGALPAAPRIHLDFAHGNSRVAGYEDCHEVWLRLRVEATLGGSPLFAAEIVQAGIFRLVPAGPARVQELFAWCSGVLYAQALRVLALTMRNGGFEPLSFHDRRFRSAFRVDVGGATINLGRLSKPGSILPALACLRGEKPPPAGARRKKAAPAWAAWLVAAAAGAFFYLIGLHNGVFERSFRPAVVPAGRVEMPRPAPETEKPMALAPAPGVTGGEEVAGQPQPPVPAISEESGPAPTAEPLQEPVPAGYAAAVAAGLRWVGDQPPGHFTLQVAAPGRLESLAQLVARYRFDEPVRLVRSATGDGVEPAYLALLGVYPSAAAARAAARRLRENHPDLAPAATPFASLKISPLP